MFTFLVFSNLLENVIITYYKLHTVTYCTFTSKLLYFTHYFYCILFSKFLFSILSIKSPHPLLFFLYIAVPPISHNSPTIYILAANTYRAPSMWVYQTIYIKIKEWRMNEGKNKYIVASLHDIRRERRTTHEN